MKITKRQLKEIIRKELNEYGFEPSNPGDEELYMELIDAIATSDDFQQLLYVRNRLGIDGDQVMDDLGQAAHRDAPEAAQQDDYDFPPLEEAYKQSKQALNEENFRTVEFMINFYQEKPQMWEWSRNDYYNMAEGKDPDGIRSEMYPHWSDEDFAAVIAEIDGANQGMY